MKVSMLANEMNRFLQILLALTCSVAVVSSMALNSDNEEDIDSVVWWKKTNFYHIYIRSFRDSDGDGNGDLRGIIEKLDYLQQVGVETLLLSPFYASPMKDGGYDVEDYTAINERFGTMEDFDNLLSGLKERGMRIVVDFVPNHSSNKHKWFKCSERALIDPENCGKYKDYYVWSNSTRYNGRPNNWLSLFDGESGWEWSEVRKEFYFHQFLAEQPDLNLTNPAVREEFKDIARFWLKKGVDGLRVDAVLHFIEDELMRDEPYDPSWNPKLEPNKYNSLKHIYTRSLSESADVVRDWKEVADEFEGDRVIITEAYDIIPKIIEYYGPTPDHTYADMPFNFDLMSLKRGVNMKPNMIENGIETWLKAIQAMNWPKKNGALDPWTCWVTGNHDNSRAVNRVGEKNADFYKWLSYLVIGAPVDYYGDELGLHDSDFSAIPKSTLDEGETSRLPFRAPMAWSASKPSGGFSSNASIWLPLNENYKTNNVEEMLKSSEKNHLKNYVDLLKIRHEYLPTLTFGDVVFYSNHHVVSTSVFSMARVHDKFGSLMLLSNLDEENDATVYLTPKESIFRMKLSTPPKEGKVILTNYNTNTLSESSTYILQGLTLGPSQTVILAYN